MRKATYPTEATYLIEPRGIRCMDCGRKINRGQPYSQRLVSVSVVDLICVYCATDFKEEDN